MSINNRNGRALEFAYLRALENRLRPVRAVQVTEDSRFLAAKASWDEIPDDMKKNFALSANAGSEQILKAEPLISEAGTDILEIKIQPDGAGIEGDVRDILIIRSGICWEIGISVKNNNFAVKHSRLSSKLDFGYKWFGAKCSEQYWSDIKPVFDYLSKCKGENLNWGELPAKEKDVYVPLLTAFLAEIERAYAKHGEILAKNMVEYLIGNYDFYKVIGINNKQVTRVQPYNLRGRLNKSNLRKPRWMIPVSAFPKRIIGVGFKPDSQSTVEIFMDNGWQFGFRIHNASTKVETSLKFDIQIIGMPATFISVDCNWE
ncbi:MAG: HaeIII family restriction endonuclease [Defluviitaleaceae bacterium]|nr:HaeIII family restriction endonuclease [Defluviitaleaceae bacterium]